MKDHVLGRGFSVFSVTLILFLVFSLFLLNGTDAETHFWDELGVVRINERVKAPSFTLRDLNGKDVKLEHQREKIVFVNFWATWCPPCRAEMPSMEKLYREFHDRDFTILAINVQEEAKKVRAFKEKLDLSFPILLDFKATVGSMYGVWSLPTTYLIDRAGYIIGGALGPRDWASKEAFDLINYLLITKPDS